MNSKFPEIPNANHPLDQPSLLWDYINQLPLKLFCVAAVEHWANLEINLKEQQSCNTIKILNVSHQTQPQKKFPGLRQKP